MIKKTCNHQKKLQLGLSARAVEKRIRAMWKSGVIRRIGLDMANLQ